MRKSYGIVKQRPLISLISQLSKSLEAVIEYFISRDDVAFAYLFGSRARGTQHSMSDVDIAVYLTESPFSAKRLEILGDMIDILRTDSVDLVVLNTASSGLCARVIWSRKVLVDKLPFLRQGFESRTIRTYLDFSKVENRILEQRYLRG